MNHYSSRDEQLAYLDYVTLQDYDSKPREIRMREAAAEVVAGSEVYRHGGTYVLIKHPRRGPTTTYLTENDALPIPTTSYYSEIHVQLAPELQCCPDVAQILVERQLAPSWP